MYILVYIYIYFFFLKCMYDKFKEMDVMEIKPKNLLELFEGMPVGQGKGWETLGSSTMLGSLFGSRGPVRVF